MTLTELLQAFRAQADDGVEPYLWSDASITGWLNEAENESCIRAGLLVDTATTSVAVMTVTANNAWITLSPLVLDVTRAVLDSTETLLRCEGPDELDLWEPGWEDATGTPESYYLDGARLRLIPTPTANDSLKLRVRRLPATPLTTASPTASPEIPAEHHRGLLDWALFRAFSQRDADQAGPGLAEQQLRLFEERFGPRPSALARRQRRERRQHQIAPIAF